MEDKTRGIKKIKNPVDIITVCYLECVLMPNDEIISIGKTL